MFQLFDGYEHRGAPGRVGHSVDGLVHFSGPTVPKKITVERGMDVVYVVAGAAVGAGLGAAVSSGRGALLGGIVGTVIGLIVAPEKMTVSTEMAG